MTTTPPSNTQRHKHKLTSGTDEAHSGLGYIQKTHDKSRSKKPKKTKIQYSKQTQTNESLTHATAPHALPPLPLSAASMHPLNWHDTPNDPPTDFRLLHPETAKQKKARRQHFDGLFLLFCLSCIGLGESEQQCARLFLHVLGTSKSTSRLRITAFFLMPSLSIHSAFFDFLFI